MFLQDINKTQIDTTIILEVSQGISAYTINVIEIDGQIQCYKYDNNELMEQDIVKINNTRHNQVLFG